MTVTLRQQGRQQGRQQMPDPGQVDLLVAQRVVEVDLHRAHRPIVTGQVADQVERAGSQQLISGLLQRCAVGDVERQRLAARMGGDEVIEGGRLARRHDHPGATCMQQAGGGAADAARGPDQPDALPVPVTNGRIQAHGAAPAAAAGSAWAAASGAGL